MVEDDEAAICTAILFGLSQLRCEALVLRSPYAVRQSHLRGYSP